MNRNSESWDVLPGGEKAEEDLVNMSEYLAGRLKKMSQTLLSVAQ